MKTLFPYWRKALPTLEWRPVKRPLGPRHECFLRVWSRPYDIIYNGEVRYHFGDIKKPKTLSVQHAEILTVCKPALQLFRQEILRNRTSECSLHVIQHLNEGGLNVRFKRLGNEAAKM